jgi:hypothetical protein
MKAIILAILLISCIAEPLIRKELIEELKKSATWKVTEYEDNMFRGIDSEDIEGGQMLTEADAQEFPEQEVTNTPKELSWVGASCDHGVKGQGDECAAASYAFAVAGMASDRCCLKGTDKGWLSPMELINCDKGTYGCAGGWPADAIEYVKTNGLVDDACYPYNGRTVPCPTKCKNNKDWNTTHSCKCTDPTSIKTYEELKSALANGPAVITFEAFEDFYAYKEGIYCHTSGRFMRLISGRVVAYNDTTTPPHITVAMSLGEKFGEKGHVRMCTSCCGMFGKYTKGNVACNF